MSRIVVLAVVRLNKYRRKNGFIWGREHYNMTKSCKNNILTDSTKHHESAGYYFSWGNRGNYETVDKSSVTQYTHMKKSGLVGKMKS